MPINIDHKKEQLIFYLESLLSRRNIVYKNGAASAMGDWFLDFENVEFTLQILHNRSGGEYIEIGSKIRSKPRAHIKSWSLGFIRGYLEGQPKDYVFESLKRESEWLVENENRIFDHALLNSAQLNSWAVKRSNNLLPSQSSK